MLFDDLFYPGNPQRRADVANLRGDIRAAFFEFKTNWNDCVLVLNSILTPKYPQLTLKPLFCHVDEHCIQMCLDEFDSVLSDAKPKLDKLVRDIGLENGIPGLGSGNIDLDPEARHKINQFIAGAVSVSVAAFATWYVTNSIRFFITIINYAGAAISGLAEVAAGLLGGLIVGAVGFVITDIIASAISGAVERQELNEAIDALTHVRNAVADPLLKAAGKLAGIVQSIRDGAYKPTDHLIIVRVGDTYEIISIDRPSSTAVVAAPDIVPLDPSTPIRNRFVTDIVPRVTNFDHDAILHALASADESDCQIPGNWARFWSKTTRSPGGAFEWDFDNHGSNWTLTYSVPKPEASSPDLDM